MLVSIIIPVYNVEKYVKRCFQSVADQTYKNIEIIIVDDGSTDSSGSKCDEFADVEKRAVVIHKNNGGLSSARNEGMRVAKGDYITFLDSDDYLSKDFVEYSIAICEKECADISIMDMAYISETSNEEVVGNNSDDIVILSRKEAIKESLYQKLFSCCAPGKMYKRKTLKGIQFPLNMLSEDLAVCHLILNNADSIVYSKRTGYYYRQQQNSIMHVFNSKRLDALQWTNEIENFCLQYYPDILHAAKCRSFNVAIHLALDLPDSKGVNRSYYVRIWKDVKRTRIAVIIDKECRFREKAAAILSFMGITTLKRVWDSKFAVKSTGSRYA